LRDRREEFLEEFARYAGSEEGLRDAAAFQRAVRESDMRYAGAPLDVAYFPLALTAAESAALAASVEAMAALLERATTAFLADPAMQAEFGWPDERLALVAQDPGYPLAVPCARFDSYWDGHAPRFLEVNTDGTSGMTNVERVTAFFLEQPGMAPLRARFGLGAFPLRERVLDALLACYRAWHERHPHRAVEPRIAIVDWREVKTRAEFEAFRRFFEERGFAACVVDPRDLWYERGELLAPEGRVDLIYRRLVSTEFFARQKELAAFTAAYRDEAVCVVGSFRSDVVFDKRLFALLHDPRFAAHFDAKDRALIARHVPATWILRQELLGFARDERERLVLKPAALYEGRGVVIGLEARPEAWDAALAAALDGAHVLQERVPAPRAAAIGPWAAGLPHYLSLGEYVFGGRLAGFNARVASTLVLGAEDDERLLPVVTV
jgi:hypothetical protein